MGLKVRSVCECVCVYAEGVLLQLCGPQTYSSRRRTNLVQFYTYNREKIPTIRRAPLSKYLVTAGRKNSLFTRRNLVHNQAQGGPVLLPVFPYSLNVFTSSLLLIVPCSLPVSLLKCFDELPRLVFQFICLNFAVS